MKTSIYSTSPSKAKVDALIITFPSFKGDQAYKALGEELASLCREADAGQVFQGREGSNLIFPSFNRIAPKLIALVGLGETDEPARIRKSIGKAVRQLQSRKVQTLGVLCSGKTIAADQIIFAIEEATYRFTEYSAQAAEAPGQISEVQLYRKAGSQKQIDQADVVAEAVRMTRDIANQPPNYFSPATLAEQALELSARCKLQCEVFDEQRLKKEGFGGILAVGQGSSNKPRFVRMDYHGGKKNDAPYVIIGKAITFDTGGISIKPSDKMDEMKFDKCGGMAVLGIMQAVAELKLPINVTGLISSAENMPSSTAYRPGDLVKSLSGKYIEIINTDAEGRVVLADALTYAHQLNPKAMVDLATLTGACIICFGKECAGVLGNNQPLIDQLKAASDRTGERIWQMPMWKEYQDKVKSDVGFVKNSTGREGGTITAACFLNSFVDPKIPWAHLDIAGTAWTSSEEAHRAKGATAFGVQLVVNWLQTRRR